VLSAFVWLGTTVHCQLEALPGFESLACLTENGCHNEPGSDGSDEGCCSVEKSEYKINQSRQTLPAPDLVLLCSKAVLDFTPAQPDEASTGILTAAPPELPRCWHFVFRTAASPRAPSFVS